MLKVHQAGACDMDQACDMDKACDMDLEDHGLRSGWGS